MRIVTYNLRAGGKGQLHWNDILEEFAPEVLLVQESYAPDEHLSPLLHGERHKRAVWSPVKSNGRNLGWGSSVYIESHVPTRLPLPDFVGSVVGVEVRHFLCPDGEQRPVRIFSIHAPTGAGMSYQKAVNAILDMLAEHRGDGDVVVGGDFNLTVSERLASEELKTSNADSRIQARLRDDFGLINCWQAANPGVPPAQTLRWNGNRSLPYHCDGLFVPASWARYLHCCHVPSGGKWDDLSDHNPVVAEFHRERNEAGASFIGTEINPANPNVKPV